ncbi:type I restriction enzyme M protein [Candidatus Methanomarinus sp.]|nr:type I restriction enzyme M protein [ANME-2 cluster archaeon]
MSSQASSAGGGEAKVRQKLVETGDVDVMVAIRSNFFYTRTVPCELWFLNRDKPEGHCDKVLMIDARNIYRKVTRKIYDFSPEQQQKTTNGDLKRVLIARIEEFLRAMGGVFAFVGS